MRAFEQLTRRAGRPAEVQERARNELPSLLALTKMNLWKPSDSFPLEGTRFLIGVVVWSVYDMKLLAALAEALSRGRRLERVDVFSMDDCFSQECIAQYVAKLPSVFATPVLGVFQRGEQVDQMSGYAAKRFVADYFAIDLVGLTA